MWRVIFDVVLLAMYIWVGVCAFKNERFKWACVDFFMAGSMFCYVLWGVDRVLQA